MDPSQTRPESGASRQHAFLRRQLRRNRDARQGIAEPLGWRREFRKQHRTRLLPSLTDSIMNAGSKAMTPTAIFLILVIAFMIRGFFFMGYYANDDFGGYAWTVGQLMGMPDMPPFDLTVLHRWSQTYSQNVGYIYGFRYGMLWPLMVLGELFGPYPNTFASYHLFLSLCQVLCVFLILRKIFGDEAGLAGALLMAIMPWDVSYSTVVLPDSPIPPYMTISLTFFIFGFDRERWWNRVLFFVAAGAFLALAYYARVYAVFLGVAMVGIFISWMLTRRRITLWPAFTLAGAALVWFAFNFVIFKVYQQTGSPIADYQAMKQAQVVFRGLYPITDHWRFSTYFWQQLLEHEAWIPFTLLAIGGAGAAVGTKKDYRLFPLLWFAGVVLVADFFTASLKNWEMVHKLPRFMTLFSAPVAALGGILLGKLTSRKALFYTSVFLAAMLVMLTLSHELGVWGVRP